MFEVNESVSDTRDIKEEEEEVRTASSREERGDAKHRQHQKCRSEAQTRIRRVFFSRSVRFEGERLSSVSERCPNRVIIHRSCWHFGNHRFHGKGRSGGSPPKTSFKSVVEKKARPFSCIPKRFHRCGGFGDIRIRIHETLRRPLTEKTRVTRRDR